MKLSAALTAIGPFRTTLALSPLVPVEPLYSSLRSDWFKDLARSPDVASISRLRVESSFFSPVLKATSLGRSAVSFGATAAAGGAATVWFTPEQPERAAAEIVAVTSEMIIILCMANVLFMIFLE